MNPHTRLSIAALLSGALLFPVSGGHTTSAHGSGVVHVTPPPYSASSTR
jgi:hypothetical protein